MARLTIVDPAQATGGERDWDGTLMAEIGQPERQIVVRPGELPVPSELPLDAPVAAPREPVPEQEPVAPRD